MAIMNHNHKDSQPHGEDCPAEPSIWGDGHNHFYTNSHAAAADPLKTHIERCGVMNDDDGLTCDRPKEEEHSASGHAAWVDGKWVRWYDAPQVDEILSKSFAELRDGNVGEVVDDRVQVYGNPVDTFARQAQAISALLGHEVHAWQVPLIMIMVKMVRVTEAPDYSDNSDDIEGYLDIFRTLMGEDMIEARSVKEYVELKMERNNGKA